VPIVIFFLAHWQLSVFFQSTFLHRYGAHRQFTMSKRAERVFHFLAWFVMGSSYLSPRAYAILHRMHHAYSDTPKDPHSPIHEPNFFKMMEKTKVFYRQLRRREVAVEPRFEGGYPEWKLFDETLNTMTTSVMWGTIYSLIYLAYAIPTGHYWVLALLPLHWFLGPIHGAIVNYCGHKVGYRNYDSDDASKNTLVFDVLTMGELFQNNHHRYGQSPNFAARWFEIDPAYSVIRVLGWLKVLDLSKAQYMRYPDRLTRKEPDALDLGEVATSVAASVSRVTAAEQVTQANPS
jgi:stearoyl-CoA desaturase (Delta-9 desaturase)